MKQYFPLSVKAKESIGSLVVSLIIYCGVFYLIRFACGILGKLPLVNLITGLVQIVVGLYCGAGVILALLFFFKVIK